MAKFSDEERAAILQQSFETLERLENFKVEDRDPERREWTLPEPEPPRQRRSQPTAAEVEMLRAQQWDAWVTGHITRAIAERDAFWREVHAEVLAEERQKTNTKLKRLRADLELKIDALAAELNKQRAVEDGGVVDLLPPVPQRKRNAAA